MSNLSDLNDAELKALHKDLINRKTVAHNMQLGKKIILNSAFGAMSNQWFLHFDDDLAESITLAGQLSIQWVERAINVYLNKVLKTENVDYVIAIDTDSMYLNLGPMVDKYIGAGDRTDEEVAKILDMVCDEKIQKVINDALEDLRERVNAPAQRLHMKREVISKQGIWTAKKKYIVQNLVNENVWYTEPKVKMVGIQAIQSSTPESCRDKIKEAIEIILDKDNDALIEHIERFRVEFGSLPFEDIAKSSSANGINEYHDPETLYKPKCPIHVRGALVYNRYLEEHKLTNKFPKLYNGDKVKFCYMKMPNPLRENVISTPGNLPRQFGLEKYIDYDTQFDKAFIQPLRSILKVIQWNTEKVYTMEDWF